MRDDKVFSALGLPQIEKEKQVEVLITDTKNDKVENDFDFARDNIRDIIKNGESALVEMISIAGASEMPRAFEVAATMMKVLLEANKGLLDLHKQKQAVDPEPEEKANVTNNNFFGSTKELQDMIEKVKNDE